MQIETNEQFKDFAEATVAELAEILKDAPLVFVDSAGPLPDETLPRFQVSCTLRASKLSEAARNLATQLNDYVYGCPGCEFVSVAMELPASVEHRLMVSDPANRIALRVLQCYDIYWDESVYRFDILFGIRARQKADDGEPTGLELGKALRDREQYFQTAQSTMARA